MVSIAAYRRVLMGVWQKLIYIFLVFLFLFSHPSVCKAFHKTKHHKQRPRILLSFHNYRVFSLKGNRFSLLRENEMADREGLDRISNDNILRYLQTKKLLVPLPQNNKIKIDPRLKEEFRWCRPWVSQFLLDFADAHYKVFHYPLQTNSAIRTIAFQLRLRKTNPNAASPIGPLASTHPTGATIDIAKKNMKHYELMWVRQYLSQKMAAHEIHVIEEFHQSVFHIMVSKYYKSHSIRNNIPS